RHPQPHCCLTRSASSVTTPLLRMCGGPFCREELMNTRIKSLTAVAISTLGLILLLLTSTEARGKGCRVFREVAALVDGAVRRTASEECKKGNRTSMKTAISWRSGGPSTEPIT